MSHFEAFLKDCIERGASDVRLVPRLTTKGKIAFYAHPQNVNGETFDGEVSGKHVRWMGEAPAPAVDHEDEDFALSEASVTDVGEALDAEEVAE